MRGVFRGSVDMAVVTEGSDVVEAVEFVDLTAGGRG